MELYCEDDILCFVEDDVDLLLPGNMENTSIGFGRLFEENNLEVTNTEKDNLFSCEADPLLSEAQIIEGHTILEAFNIRIPQTEFVLKKQKSKEPPSIILISDGEHERTLTLEKPTLKEPLPIIVISNGENSSTDLNSFTDKHITVNDMSNNQILLTNKLHVVEMDFLDNSASLVFRDIKGNQIFLTQQMQLPDNYMPPEKTQRITSVVLVQICKELDVVLPQIITNLGAKIHLCPLRCTKAFLHIADAKLHALKHMEIKPYKCDKPDCPWEFYTACKLARHAETHSQNKNFVCDILNCKKTFSTIYNLNEHKKKHNKPATLPCPVKGCNQLFQNDNQRRAHFKTHNHSEAPFRCNNGKCTKSFFAQTLLDAHSRSCIQKGSQIVCNYPDCGKTFPTPYRLREHIRQHTGVKPYECTFQNCTWRFATASKLKRHQSTHTRDRKFHCTMGNCNKSFFRSEHLKEHTLTHIEKRSIDAEGKSALANAKKNNPEKKEKIKVQSEEDSMTTNTNADALLEQAIQSLGMPSDIIMSNGLISDEPLALMENENFSTVNLRDLD
ncbi:hypothetical protein NQ314_012370 [Rhamnusium bicolor]|uniref:C2H2-type domain-containing protein n=1 Tax=Rhamnusium bicolor TaxID=1586634 RepID=A0AAV8XCJ3_9CUCU|nr:hypothetical protein NQ314_012370 [Rhamnusium bicolor]